MTKTILILAANPVGEAELSVCSELRQLRNVLQPKFEVQLSLDTSWDDFNEEIRKHKPDIVHFVGHGRSEDGLVLEGAGGVTGDRLAALFALFPQVDCVVMNACQTERVAMEIHRHVRCVIGMSQSIADQAAREFALGFYQGLLEEKGYEWAFEYGKVRISSAIGRMQPSLLIRDEVVAIVDLESPIGRMSLRDDSLEVGEMAPIAAQNFKGKIHKSFISLFGNRQAPIGTDWDWATQVLEVQLIQIQTRLTDVLLEDQLLTIDAVERLDFVGRSPLTPMRQLEVKGKKVVSVDPDRMMIELFERKDIKGKLLILGRPGAGKSTALLNLAKELVEGAISNPRTVIPVIFELSAWKDDGQSIEAFLIEQLYENLGGNRKSGIYETWLEQRLLLPLLDGLDELGIERQRKCTIKLNEFAKTYPQIVVCCRVREFENVGIKLNELRGSIVLQPLSNQQIQDYLVMVNQSELWEQILDTPEMLRMLEPDEEGEPGLLQVPLFISIATMIYDQTLPFRTKGELFEAYIDRQLSFDVRNCDRSGKESAGRNWAFETMEGEFDRAAVIHSLSWLAKQLQERHQVDLLIEQMQPSWLSPVAKRRYRRVVGLIGGLIIGLIAGLIVGLIFDPIIGVIVGLIFGLVVGLIVGPMIGLDDIRPVEGFRISRSRFMQREILHGLKQWLIAGLVAGLTFGLIFGLLFERIRDVSLRLIFGLIIGLVGGSIAGLIIGLIGGLTQDLKVRLNSNQGIWNSLQSVIWITILSYPMAIIFVMIGPIAIEFVEKLTPFPV